MLRLKQINKSINTTNSGNIDYDIKNLSDLVDTLYNKLNKLLSDYNSYTTINNKNIESIQIRINEMVDYMNTHP